MKRSKFSTIANKVQSREFGTLSIWAFGIVVVLAALWAHRVSNWADPDPLPPFLFFYPAVVIAALAGGPKLGVFEAAYTFPAAVCALVYEGIAPASPMPPAPGSPSSSSGPSTHPAKWSAAS